MTRCSAVFAALAVLAMCGAAAVCQTPAAASQPAKTLTAEQAKALTAKLGDADFKVREAAQKELAQAGAAALDALEQALKSDDAEVRQRAAEAIKEVRSAIAMAVSLEMAKNYLWSHPMDNGAIGSPVVYGGAAYIVGQDGKLHAVDVKTGKLIWDAAMSTRGSGQISAGDKVVAVTVGMTLTVFEVKKGDELWKKDFRPAAVAPAGGAGGGAVPVKPLPAPLPPVPAGGAALAPAPINALGGGAQGGGAGAAGGAVVARGPVAVAGRIGYVQPRAWVAGDVVVARVALDKLKAFKALTGEDAWEIEVKPGSPMCFPVVDGGIAYLTEGDSVTAIDLATQKRLWTTELANCTSLARGGQALVCQAGGKIVALDVSKKGEKLWDADLPEGGAGGGPALNVPVAKVRGFGGLVVDDSRVYMVAGDEMVTYDLKKGEKASSKLDLTLPEEGAKEGAAAGDGVGTVVVGPGGGAGGMVVIQGGGNVMMTSASGGLMRWTASGGMVYAATNKGLFAFDGKSGQRLWLLTINQRLSGDPVVAGGAIFFGTMRAYGPAAAPDEKALPKDLPGLHAVKLKEVAATPTTAPAAAPAKAPDGKP